MKKLAVILIIALLILSAWITWNIYTVFFVPNISSTALPVDRIYPTITPKIKNKEIVVNNEHFNYSSFSIQNTTTIHNTTRVSLIPNFSTKESSQTIIEKNNCKQAINGGFYDKQNKPLGLFMADRKDINEQIPSALLNGFLTISIDDYASINNDLPASVFRIALQSGPLLMTNARVLPLHILNDEHARRMITAKTTKGELIFITVYNDDAVFEGPLLADLPLVVDTINRQDNLNISDALNLDGGSASAFYNGETSLSEITPVGSLFCIQ